MKYGTTNIDQEDKEKTALREENKKLREGINKYGMIIGKLVYDLEMLIQNNTTLEEDGEALLEICASAKASSVQPS